MHAGLLNTVLHVPLLRLCIQCCALVSLHLHYPGLQMLTCGRFHVQTTFKQHLHKHIHLQARVKDAKHTEQALQSTLAHLAQAHDDNAYLQQQNAILVHQLKRMQQRQAKVDATTQSHSQQDNVARLEAENEALRRQLHHLEDVAIGMAVDAAHTDCHL